MVFIRFKTKMVRMTFLMTFDDLDDPRPSEKSFYILYIFFFNFLKKGHQGHQGHLMILYYYK